MLNAFEGVVPCRLFPLLQWNHICTEGDDMRSDNPTKAIEMFEKVVDLETKLGDQVKW